MERTWTIEFAGDVSLGCQGSLLISGNLRLAETRAVNHGDARTGDDLIGPLVGLEYSRSASDNLSRFVLGRGAFLFGDSTDDGVPEGQTNMMTGELQLGAEYRIASSRGGYWFARAAFEGQILSGFFDDDTEDSGLIGGHLSVGLNRYGNQAQGQVQFLCAVAI